MNYRSDDGLGAAYGLWEAMKIVGGGFLLFWWVYGTMQTLKAGNWETWLVASGSLAFCVLHLDGDESGRRPRTSSKGQLTAISHRLGGVVHQIHEHLVELHRVSLDRREGRIQILQDLYTLVQFLLSLFFGKSVQHCVEVNCLSQDLVLPGEVQ